MNDPRISVIMPVYNNERYLSDAIESVLAQSYADFEFLVINDGSSDSSLAIAQSIAKNDSRIRIIENEKNLGIVETLNLGLERAGAEFIARMDADDISLPTRFEKQIKILETNPDIGVVGTSYYVIDELGDVQDEFHPPASDVLIRWQLLFHNPFAHPSVMYRAGLAKRIQYRDTYLHCEDYEFWTRFLQETKGANLEEPLLYYRKTASSISGTHSEIQTEGATKLSRQQIKFLMNMDLVTLEETTKLRKWYQTNLIPLFDPSEFHLFEKWIQIYAAFSAKYRQHSKELAKIREKIQSVNTFLSTREQIDQNPLWISVVVCTFNRADHLSRLLDSIESQTLSKNRYEVIIVDNNSTDDTPDIARAFCEEHSNVVCVTEENQGLAHARNRGMEEARGVFVAYTDDDAVLPETWLEKAANIISKCGYAALGGPYYPFYEQKKPYWYKDEYGSSSWLPKEECFLEEKFLVGGNMFYRKDFLKAVNGFPVDYGMSGGSLGYGEETYMQIKMRNKFPVVKTYFSPDMYIKHLVDKKKMRVFWPIRRYFTQGMDAQRHENKNRVGQKAVQENRAMIILRLLKLVLRMAYEFLVKIQFRNKDKFTYWQNYVYNRGQYYGYNFGKQWAKLTDK